MRVDDVAGNRLAATSNARHVTGCHLIEETRGCRRVPMTWRGNVCLCLPPPPPPPPPHDDATCQGLVDIVLHVIGSPRHRVPRDSRDEGSRWPSGHCSPHIRCHVTQERRVQGGLVDIAPHSIERHMTQETRVQGACR